MAGGSQRIWLVDGWEDPWFELLDSAHKVAFMYLVLGPNARPSGLYVQSVRTMALALNTEPAKVEAVLADFDRDGKVHRDPDRGLVWVANACATNERIGMGPGVRRSVEKDVQMHGESPLVERFLARYPQYSVPPGSHPSPTGVGSRRDTGGSPDPSMQLQEQELEQPQRRSTPKPARAPDDLWDALVDVLGLDAGEITKSRRGRLNAALAQLREVDATPDELRRRAKEYRRAHPEWEFTETALATHWAGLARKKRKAPVERLSEPEPVRDDEVNQAGLARMRELLSSATRPIEEAA